jgi:hypothetical protein
MMRLNGTSCFRGRGARATRFATATLVACTLVAGSRPARAQELTTALGLGGGLLAGAYVTTGLYVLRSRTTGWVLHSPSELLAARPEAVPVVVAPIVGAVLGYQSPHRLSAAAAWGGVGFVSGGAIGVGIGHLIWGNSEGRWAGGTIGSALGLAVGAIAGAVDRADDEVEAPAASYLSFSIPLGGRR